MSTINVRTSAATAIKRLALEVDAMTDPSVSECEYLLTTLANKFRSMEDAHDGLVAVAVGEGELDTHADFWTQIERVYRKAYVRLQDFTAAARRKERPGRPTSTTATTFTEKLEPLKVPIFNGENWTSFRPLYESMVHYRDDLSNESKLARLRHCVDPINVRALEGASDYEETWGELMRRYDQPQQLVEQHMRKLTALPRTPKETQANVREVIDVVRTTLRIMRTQGQDPVNCGPVLYPIILEKLPANTQCYWKRNNPKTVPQIPEMMECLEMYAETMSIDEEVGRRDGAARRTVGSFAAMVNTGCQWCGEEHRSRDCPMFRGLSPGERRSRVSDARACFICFSQSHMTAACQDRRCPKCNGGHHGMLCTVRARGGIPAAVTAVTGVAPGATNTNNH